MAARRAAGEGSVHKRKHGGWQGSIDVGIVDGRRKRKTVYGATQREVLDKLTAIRRTLDAGLPVGTSRPMTLGDYLEAWLRDTLPAVVRPSTAASYSSLTRKHIIPGLGHHRLDKLTAVHIRAFLQGQDHSDQPAYQAAAFVPDDPVPARGPAPGPGAGPPRRPGGPQRRRPRRWTESAALRGPAADAG